MAGPRSGLGCSPPATRGKRRSRWQARWRPVPTPCTPPSTERRPATRTRTASAGPARVMRWPSTRPPRTSSTITGPTSATYGAPTRRSSRRAAAGRASHVRRGHLDSLLDRGRQAPRPLRHRHLHDHRDQGRRRRLRADDLGALRGHDQQGRPGDPVDHRPRRRRRTATRPFDPGCRRGGSGPAAITFNLDTPAVCAASREPRPSRSSRPAPARSPPPRPPTRTTSSRPRRPSGSRSTRPPRTTLRSPARRARRTAPRRDDRHDGRQRDGPCHVHVGDASTACSIVAGKLHVVSGTGTCTITATKAGDADYEPTTSAPFTSRSTRPPKRPCDRRPWRARRTATRTDSA